jgi:hypothetical protein
VYVYSKVVIFISFFSKVFASNFEFGLSQSLTSARKPTSIKNTYLLTVTSLLRVKLGGAFKQATSIVFHIFFNSSFIETVVSLKELADD